MFMTEDGEKLYTFDELDEIIKDEIANEEIIHCFEYDYEDLLHECEIPHYFEDGYDDIDAQWSLSCCQGDGVNVYGEATYKTWYEAARKLMPYGKETQPAEDIIPREILDAKYEHCANRNYCYSTWNMRNDIEDMAEQMAWDYIDNQNPFDPSISDDITEPDDLNDEMKERFETIATIIQEGMEILCHDLEKMGYDEMDYYRTQEHHEGKLFTEDGVFWGYESDIPVITRQLVLDVAA